MRDERGRAVGEGRRKWHKMIIQVKSAQAAAADLICNVTY